MSRRPEFDASMDQDSIWKQILDKMRNLEKQKKTVKLNIKMTPGLQARITAAMFMGRIESVAQFMKMAITLLEKTIEAESRGGTILIRERNGDIKVIKVV
jgi:hypothetical protein